MSRRNLKKTTSVQFDFLIREMSMRPDAARGKVYGHNRDQIVSDWKEIVQKLNEMGPPQRTVTEWKKVWSDLRKRLQNRRNSTKSSTPSGTKANSNKLDFAKQHENSLQLCEVNPAEVNLYEDASVETFKMEKQFAPSENNLTTQQMMVDNSHLPEVQLLSPHSIAYDKLFLYPNSRMENNEAIHPDNLNGSNTSNHLQYQMEQQTRLMDKLSDLSQIISLTMERQAVAMEKQTAALERQTIAVEQHNRLLNTLVEYCLGPANKSDPTKELLLPNMR